MSPVATLSASAGKRYGVPTQRSYYSSFVFSSNFDADVPMDTSLTLPSLRDQQWNMIPEYVSPPHICHSTFDSPNWDSVQPPIHWNAASPLSFHAAVHPRRNAGNEVASMPLELPVDSRNRTSSEHLELASRPSHLGPTVASHEVAEVASILDRFDKSLRLAAYKMPFTHPEQHCYFDSIIEDTQCTTLEPVGTDGGPQTSVPFATINPGCPIGPSSFKSQDQIPRIPRLHDTSPTFEHALGQPEGQPTPQERTEQGGIPCSLDLAGIRPPQAPLLADTLSSSPVSRLIHPLAHPRPPTPPILRRKKPAAHRPTGPIRSAAKKDHQELLQASIQAGKRAQLQNALRLLPDRRYDVGGEDETRRKVRRRRSMGFICTRCRREQLSEEEHHDHSPKKWTRFVMPDDLKGEEDPIARLSNTHRHTRRASWSGPLLRSILRNKDTPAK